MEDKKPKRGRVVTIDGPAGAGKTTLARNLADALPGFHYVDTGAFYRLLGAAVLRHGITLADIIDDTAGAAAYLADLDAHGELAARCRDGVQTMFLMGRAVPDPGLRTVDVTTAASVLGADPDVRAIAGRLIRKYAGTLDCVVEGRDAGTALFPDADVKFYLWAGLRARAERRLAEMERSAAGGCGITVEILMEDIEKRDARDGSRAAAPLRIPDGAIYIDSSAVPAEPLRRCLAAMARHLLDPGSSPVA